MQPTREGFQLARPPLPTVPSRSRLCGPLKIAARAKRHSICPRRSTRSFYAPIFSKIAEWGRTGARRRGLCSRARKIRTHCVIIKWPAWGLAGSPVPGPPVAFPQRPILCHTMCSYLSELTLPFSVSGRALPAQAVTARPWPTPRSTSPLARIQSGFFERERTNFISHRRAGRSLPVLPVVTARRDGRERHSNFIRPVSPGQRDERRHGQTHFVLGAKLGRDVMTAGLCFRSRHDDTFQRRGKPTINFFGC